MIRGASKGVKSLHPSRFRKLLTNQPDLLAYLESRCCDLWRCCIVAHLPQPHQSLHALRGGAHQCPLSGQLHDVHSLAVAAAAAAAADVNCWVLRPLCLELWPE